MGSTRRAIRVGLLFGGMALSLASLPALLNKVEAIKQGATPGASPTLQVEGLTMPDAEAPDPRALLEARHAPRANASTPKPPTRVLGPDE